MLTHRAARAPHPTSAEAKGKAERRRETETESAYTYPGEIDRLTTRAYVDDKKKYMLTQTLSGERPDPCKSNRNSRHAVAN